MFLQKNPFSEKKVHIHQKHVQKKQAIKFQNTTVNIQI